MGTRRALWRSAAVFACAASIYTAAADISNVVFQITASNAAGSGQWQGTIDGGSYIGGVYVWSQPTPIVITDTDTGAPIATLTAANTSIIDDPQINLGFAVQAGNTDTNFTITSALLSFPAMNNAQGQSAGTLTVTDTNSNGVQLTGLHGAGGSYLTQYNGFVPGGTTFSETINSVSAPAGNSSAGTANVPPIGALPIPGLVGDMSASLSFTLTANDVASGTTNFRIVPEPSTLALLGLGAGWLRRRR